MSAIAGMVDFAGGSCATEASAMRAALGFVPAERDATWNDGGCALVTKRRVIVEGDRTAPLLTPADSGIVVAIEGHLFNRPELAAALGRLPDADDEELIAAAWEKWGDGFLARLNGEFALAAWDGRRRRLLLANDHVATVPLYYAHDARGRVAFGTEIAPILAATGCRAEPDWTKIADYLAKSHREEERTFVAGIAAVPVGGAVICSEDAQVRSFRYWNYAEVVFPRFRNVEEGIEAFAAGLRQAVSRRLPIAGGVGSHLTGGLDSSAVAAVAADVLGSASSGLQLLSVVAALPGTPGAMGDVDFIPKFLQRYPQCPHAYLLGQMGENYPLPGVPNGPVHLELTGAIEEMTVRAKAAGVRAMFTGHGGEVAATFAGYGVYWTAAKQGDWAWLASEMMAQPRAWAKGRWVRRRVFGESRRPIDPYPVLRWERASEELRPEFLAEFGVRDRCLASAPFLADPLLDAQIQQLQGLRHRDRLKSWARHARAEGFRYRYPLLDRELVELVRGLPARVHVHRGRRRELMRRAVEPLLPQEITRREDKRSGLVSPSLSAADGGEHWRMRARAVWPWIQPIVKLSQAEFEAGMPNDFASPQARARRIFRGSLIAVGEYLARLDCRG